MIPPKRFCSAVSALLAVCLVGFPAPSYAQDEKPAVKSSKKVDNPQELARKARAVYYNLRTEGLVRYQCTLTFDWNAMLDALKVHDADSVARIEKFKKIRFTFDLGPTGSVQITHTDLEAATEDEARRFNQAYAGIDQMVKGFFGTWSEYMLWNMFDGFGAASEVMDEGDRYRYSERTADGEVLILFDKDYVIQSTRISSPQLTGSVQPQFTPTPQGLVLKSYSGDYKGPLVPTGGRLSVALEYQPVNALQLPSLVTATAESSSQSYAVRLTFSDCKAEKR